MKVSKSNIIKLIIYTIIMTLIWNYGNKPEGDFVYLQYMFISYVLYFAYLKYKADKKDSAKAKQLKEEKEEYKRRTTIVSSMITEVVYKEKGGLSGALVGNHFFGFLGGLVGYTLTRYEEPKYVYFLVTYLDGHSENIKTKYNSHKYKELMRHCLNA